MGHLRMNTSFLKGTEVSALEDEHAEADRARTAMFDVQSHCRELESMLSERDSEITQMREVSH